MAPSIPQPLLPEQAETTSSEFTSLSTECAFRTFVWDEQRLLFENQMEERLHRVSRGGTERGNQASVSQLRSQEQCPGRSKSEQARSSSSVRRCSVLLRVSPDGKIMGSGRILRSSLPALLSCWPGRWRVLGLGCPD